MKAVPAKFMKTVQRITMKKWSKQNVSNRWQQEIKKTGRSGRQRGGACKELELYLW